MDRWVHVEAPAERLAALRILVGVFVTIYLVANVAEVNRLATQNPQGFDPIGAARLLSGPLGSVAAWTWWASAVVLGVLFCLGLGFRIAGPGFALLVFGWASYRSSWGQMLHFEHLFAIHLLVLAVAPAADVWTIGRRGGQRPSASARYGWPIRLMAIATVAAYALSGLAKLRLTGLAWLNADTLANHIAYSARRVELVGGPSPPLAEFVLSNRWLVTPLAAAALVVELGAPLALLGRRWRTPWILAALLFHMATAATMLVFFGYRGLGIGLAPLVAIEVPVRRMLDRYRSREVPLTV